MKMIILVGLPGSGKSSFAKKYDKYTIINQDTLGSRENCIKLCRLSLLEGKSIIVDRCNSTKMQRSIWIKEALKFGVTDISAVYLYCNPEICIERISERKDHPTIKETSSKEKNTEIVTNFLGTFEMPEIEEGFDKILVIDNGKV